VIFEIIHLKKQIFEQSLTCLGNWKSLLPIESCAHVPVPLVSVSYNNESLFEYDKQGRCIKNILYVLGNIDYGNEYIYDELIQKLVIKKTGCGNNSSTTRF